MKSFFDSTRANRSDSSCSKLTLLARYSKKHVRDENWLGAGAGHFSK
ncbi:hypothetical protein M3204_09430 [Mesobacillus subterraneus]|nr:hypothetical protein [Mesobacillus subterraneus]MCM3664624.1 hypothetical protein [Mesobacillus subterraneus]MCM3683862.1 hypothetical protein [Mesobacillus subterraneus]